MRLSEFDRQRAPERRAQVGTRGGVDRAPREFRVSPFRCRYDHLSFGLWIALLLFAAVSARADYYVFTTPPVAGATVRFGTESAGVTDQTGWLAVNEGRFPPRAGGYSVRVEKDGRVLGERSFDPALGINTLYVEVRPPQAQSPSSAPGLVTRPARGGLDAGELYVVEVLDGESGAPVPRAEIWVDGVRTAQTDDAGKAFLPGLLPGVSYQVSVSAEGYQQGTASVSTADGLNYQAFRLESEVGGSKAVIVLGLLCVVGLASLVLILVKRQMNEPAGTGSYGMAASATLVSFDRYQVVRQIGQGGVATIYHARDSTQELDVALKVLDPKWLGDPEMVQKFLAEADALRAIQKRHPKADVVRLYRSGREGDRLDGRPFLAMELLNGESLDHRLRRNGRLDEAEALGLGIQVARALHCIHDVGIVHRDLTPDNIFLINGHLEVQNTVFRGVPRAVLIDFGVARQEYLSRVTMDGSIAGKPPYMSPEQCRGMKVDFRSDLYAFGAILFALVTGQPPFNGKNPFEIMRAHEHQAPPSLVGTTSGDFALIVSQLLQKRPDDRPSAALIVASRLENLFLRHAAAIARTGT